MANGISMYFDGVDDRLNNTNAVTGVGVAATVRVRFKCTDVSGATLKSLVNVTESSSARLAIGLQSGIIRGGFYNGSTWTSKSSFVIQANRWYDVILTWNGTSIALYVDNMLQTGALSPDADTGLGIYIGRKSGGTSYFNGFIDLVQVWNRALTNPSRLSSIALDRSGLIREYLFTEGGGISTTSDSSGQGFNLTIAGPIYSSESRTKTRTPVSPPLRYGTIEYAPSKFSAWVSAYKGVMFSRSVGDGKRLQRSYDNGRTWQVVYTFADNVHNALRLPSGTIIASTGTASFDATPGDIYRSTDNGATFTKVLDLDNGECIHWSMVTNGTSIFVGEYGQYPSLNVWRSTDDGANWAKVFTNPDTLLDVHVHGLAVDPRNPNIVALCTGDETAYTYYSTDGGANFTQVISDGDLQFTRIVIKDPYVFLFTDNGTGDIYRDTKANFAAGTANPVKVFDGIANGARSQIYSATQDKYGRIYAGFFDEDNAAFDGGSVWVTADDGVTWEELINYPNTDNLAVGIQMMSDGYEADTIAMFGNQDRFFFAPKLVS